MLLINNRQSLRDDGELLPLIEQLATCVAEGRVVRSVQRGADSLRTAKGWLVFCDSQNQGMAVNIEGVVSSKSELRRRLNSLRCAQTVIESFGGTTGFSLRLTDAAECPSDWIMYQVSVAGGCILCAASLPSPKLPLQERRVLRRTPRIACPFVGYLPSEGLVSVGETWNLKELAVEWFDQRVCGHLRVGKEGIMVIQADNSVDFDEEGVAETPAPIGAVIRLDLGDIELSLDEIAALRAGSRIELQADMPMSCFMRVGSTVLAQGELSIGEDGGLVVRIQEVAG